MGKDLSVGKENERGVDSDIKEKLERIEIMQNITRVLYTAL